VQIGLDKNRDEREIRLMAKIQNENGAPVFLLVGF
jgi:hypothetical protein